jgi:hypothetical protein
MKAPVWVALLALAAGASGQRPGVPGQSSGLPPVSPIPSVQPVRPPAGPYRPANRFAGGRYGYAGPLLWGGYDYDYYPPAPNVIVVPPAPAPVVVQEVPPPVAHSEVREYALATAPAGPQAEQASFAIVLKDGSIRSAVAVSVQDNTVHYVDPDGQHLNVSLDQIDRDATKRLNTERKLRLQLPAR